MKTELVLSPAHRHPHRSPLDPGRDRLRDDARRCSTDEAYKVAPTSPLPPWVEPRQPGARQRGRELRAVRSGGADRARRRQSRRRSPWPAQPSISMPAACACRGPHQPASACSRRGRSCSRSPGSLSSPMPSSSWAGRCDDPTSGLAREHILLHWKNSSASERSEGADDERRRPFASTRNPASRTSRSSAPCSSCRAARSSRSRSGSASSSRCA